MKPARLAAAFVVFLLSAVAAIPQVGDPAPTRTPIDLVIAGALQQVGQTLSYDGQYRRIAYPGGDVPLDRGVCTDVIVRAYRHAGVDLQRLVHEDMKRAWKEYPKTWGLARPDPNIDHRRVPNLQVFFRRHATALPASLQAADYLPGDIVSWRLPSGHPHIGLVANQCAGGRCLVVHNIGAGTQVEDILFAYTITGHYRFNGVRR